MEKRISIMKFGGASICTAERMIAAADLIDVYSEKNNVVVVISAFQVAAGQTVTDTLISLWKTHHENQIVTEMSRIYTLHMQVLEDLQLEEKQYFLVQKELKTLFGQLALHIMLSTSDSHTDYAYALSFGERLSACLLTAALYKRKKQTTIVDSSACIIIEDTKLMLSETETATQKIITPLLTEQIIPVVTGFFGGTKQKQVALLGRGGSDYSATILAHALHAQEVILWKEVDGVFDSDPKRNPQATLFSELSYEQASLLAEQGARVLHHEAMKPVQEKEIPVWVKNVFRPDNPGTKIWKGAYENA